MKDGSFSGNNVCNKGETVGRAWHGCEGGTDILLPMEKNPTKMQEKNVIRLRNELGRRYYDAPDLQDVGKNAYRFINAVSDFATHADPLRKTANYNENLFSRTVDGNPLIDRAYQIVKAAA